MKKLTTLLLSIATLTFSSLAFSGASYGPSVTVGVAPPRAFVYYNVLYNGNSYARVVVNGDGSTDLDCYVFDANNNLVAEDSDGTDYCVLSWVPRWNGYFRIEVRNLGVDYNRFTARTN